MISLAKKCNLKGTAAIHTEICFCTVLKKENTNPKGDNVSFWFLFWKLFFHISNSFPIFFCQLMTL